MDFIKLELCLLFHNNTNLIVKIKVGQNNWYHK